MPYNKGPKAIPPKMPMAPPWETEVHLCASTLVHTLYGSPADRKAQHSQGQGNASSTTLGQPRRHRPGGARHCSCTCGAPSSRVSTKVRRPVPLLREAQHRGPAWPAWALLLKAAVSPRGVLSSLSSFPFLENCGSSLGG